jgi:hypothetical protein
MIDVRAFFRGRNQTQYIVHCVAALASTYVISRKKCWNKSADFWDGWNRYIFDTHPPISFFFLLFCRLACRRHWIPPTHEHGRLIYVLLVFVYQT